MPFVTAASLIAATVCFTFAIIYVGVWARQPRRLDHFFFAVSALSVATFTLFESAAMHAESPQHYGDIVRWAHVPGFGMIVGLAWFLHFYMRAGRRWLLWTVTGLRTLTVIINFILTPNINQREISGISYVNVLGDQVSVAHFVPNPWMVVAQASLLLAIVYCADSTLTVWRRGNRRMAIAVGGATTFFLLVNMAMAVLILWGLLSFPYTLSVFFTGIIISMAFGLSSDLLSSFGLMHALDRTNARLRETEQRMILSAEAANVGAWERRIGDGTIWASPKWYELFELDDDGPIAFEDILKKVHPDDRALINERVAAALTGGQFYETEYRVQLASGGTRWISARFRADRDQKGVQMLRGASVDITRQKEAETAARALSGKLIDAQEAERSRLARALHDDISQRLALLSIRFAGLGDGSGNAESDIAAIDAQIQELSREIHRISHGLHPAKLEQLGLESALRGFCRDVAIARELEIDFESLNVPRELPDDISLCLYRVAQESLQNVARHSGASDVTVKLVVSDNTVSMSVRDNGCGFDPDNANSNGCLGLVSMRERMRLVNGSFEIDSSPGRGTTINAVTALPHL
ncbi:MAG TPA: PAS domain-containing protein [Pyrinomonadaceae bacterium]|jgi:signal transduction histidine kinase|nr:PAS domain-containing protein [Pyrinomonadaceae bacterium]